MFKAVLVFALVAGCGGDDNNNNHISDGGAGTPPALSGVFPISAFTGRDTRIEVSGDATEFVDGTTVDFGAGITVSAVTVASPRTLFADIAIDPTAALGTRDVTVTSGTDTFTLPKALELDSPVLLSQPKIYQGGTQSIHFENLDPAHPFDTTCGELIDNICYYYPNLHVEAVGGDAFDVLDVDGLHATALIDIDILATTVSVDIVSTEGANQIHSVPATSLVITPRTPKPLPTTATAMVLDDDNTALYTVTTTPNVVTDITIITGSLNSNSTVNLFPASGRLGQQLDQDFANATTGVIHTDIYSPTADTYYVLYDGVESHNPTIASKSVTPTSMTAEAEPNSTSVQAQAITLPAVFTSAKLDSATDIDWLKLTVDASLNGKTLRVFVFGDANTTVNAYNGGTSIGMSGDHFEWQTYASSTPLATGTSFISLSATLNTFDVNANTYTAIVWAE